MGYRYMLHYGFGHGGDFMMILFVLLFIAILYVLFKSNKNNTLSVAEVTENPLTILKKRYAKGEIDKAKFEEKKKDII